MNLAGNREGVEWSPEHAGCACMARVNCACEKYANDEISSSSVAGGLWSRTDDRQTDRQQRATRNEANENEADVTEQVTDCHDDTPLVDHSARTWQADVLSLTCALMSSLHTTHARTFAQPVSTSESINSVINIYAQLTITLRHFYAAVPRYRWTNLAQWPHYHLQNS